MRLIFEDAREEDWYEYSIEVESIILNMDSLDESLVEETASELAKEIVDKIEDNRKYIEDALEIDDFEIGFESFKSPILRFELRINKLVDNDSLYSVLGRYTTIQHEEEFTVDGKTSTIKFKPVRGELKIGFLA